jgi:hypothetical protein
VRGDDHPPDPRQYGGRRRSRLLSEGRSDTRGLGINISAAAREGVAAAVRDALADSDRAAYERHPEEPDSFWTDAAAWGKE